MSCATLKRPLDSDYLFSPNSRPATKRRRLAARGLFGIGNPSPSSSSALALINQGSGNSSPFNSPQVASPQLSPEQMQVRIRAEISHLRRMKRLNNGDKDGGFLSSSVTVSTPLKSSSSNIAATGTASLDFGETMKNGVGLSKDPPLFTFRQVGLICERMMAEKEESLRREYEAVLSSKLAEQYDTFVKFTHDQIQKNFQAASAPSYLS